MLRDWFALLEAAGEVGRAAEERDEAAEYTLKLMYETFPTGNDRPVDVAYILGLNIYLLEQNDVCRLED